MQPQVDCQCCFLPVGSLHMALTNLLDSNASSDVFCCANRHQHQHHWQQRQQQSDSGCEHAFVTALQILHLLLQPRLTGTSSLLCHGHDTIILHVFVCANLLPCSTVHLLHCTFRTAAVMLWLPALQLCCCTPPASRKNDGSSWMTLLSSLLVAYST